MAYEGLLDFQAPARTGSRTLFYAYATPGEPFFVLPDALAVASRPSGQPDFSLEKVRVGVGETYGVLDLRVTSRCRLDEALAQARTITPDSTVRLAPLASGFLRFTLVQDAATGVPANFLGPVEIASDGLGTIRLVVRLTTEAALLVERALMAEALAVSALAEMEVIGVSPRVPLMVAFDPKRLLEFVSAAVGKDGLVSRADVISALLQREAMPLTITGDGSSVEPLLLAEVLCDRIRARYASAAPAPTLDGKAYMKLAPADPGRVEWDLKEPELVHRPLVLSFDPLNEARAIVAQHGAQAVIHLTDVEPINTGFLRVLLSANLPSFRPNVASAGANLRALANPPKRPQPISETVEFAPPVDRGGATLHFSPLEPQKYSVVPYVITTGASGKFSTFEGAPVPASSGMVTLYPDQFGVRFLPVEFAKELLEIASVTLVLSSGESFPIPDGVTAAAIALPNSANPGTIRVNAAEKGGHGLASFGPVQAAPLHVGLTSFREYGAHTISIETEFIAGDALLALDLQAETASDWITVAFTPDHPQRRWGWTASSPFRAGYRYRWHGDASQPAGEWSEVQQPFSDLKVSSAIAVRASAFAVNG